ncbi:MAG: VOC family protein [Bdellovibrionales bacterium]|nr:VOC family protein [Bdellovibrionales bacterium]
MNSVGWFEIYVDDMSRAKAFYEAVFLKKLEKLETPPGEGPLEMWSFSGDMQSYGANGSLVKMEGVTAGGNSTIVYFSCVDCAVEEKRAAASGGKISKSKFSIGPYGFIALVEDTEGNMFGLHSLK